MKDFLLEILSEEIPAKMQPNAAINFAKIAFENLQKSGVKISQNQISCFTTPRRIALHIKDLQEDQIIAKSQRIGPKIDANEKAINGFVKSCGLESKDQLATTKHNNATCFLFEKPQSSTKTKEIIAKTLPIILQKMTNSWSKLMRYENNSKQVKWIRPVRNILCIFGEEIIDFEFFGLKSNANTFGHFLFNDKVIKIDCATKYQEILRDNFVIIDQNKRRKEIVQQINKIKFSHDLETIDDENSGLFDEVNGLCEWPSAMLGEIDEKFMDLPQEILILALKLNQKFFCLKEKDGKLSKNFIFISNSPQEIKDQENIKKDNEKVSKARLEDAKFFIEEDLKTPLIDQYNALKNITFHQKLGSIFERCERIEHLGEFIALWINHCDISKIERAANLCKADLVTKTVTEFPELQGKIGSYYAKKQGEDQQIIDAIYEHYLPLGGGSALPKTPLGISLAIADKVDLITGMFLANQKPTSSKDPFALRRAAIGVIRICLENNIAIPFRVLIAKSLKIYKPALISKLLNEVKSNEKIQIKRKNLTQEIAKFFIERLKNYLKDNAEIRPDILNSVIDDYIENFESHKYGDIVNLAKKANFVNQLIKKEENHNLVELYKRSANILAIEEKKDGKKYDKKPHRLTLKIDQEKVLYKIIKEISPEFKKLNKKGDYEQAFMLLKLLEIPLFHFFEKVTINDKNNKLRENRLAILAKIRELFLSVADFSKIEL